MALFSSNKKKTVKKEKAVSSAPAKEVKDSSGSLEGVLVAPWLSEKALIGTEKGVYVFEVSKGVTKKQVALAVQKLYKVAPRRVNLVNVMGKRKALRKKRGFGTRVSRSKAYVYLKKGETIQFA